MVAVVELGHGGLGTFVLSVLGGGFRKTLPT